MVTNQWAQAWRHVMARAHDDPRRFLGSMATAALTVTGAGLVTSIIATIVGTLAFAEPACSSAGCTGGSWILMVILVVGWVAMVAGVIILAAGAVLAGYAKLAALYRQTRSVDPFDTSGLA